MRHIFHWDFEIQNKNKPEFSEESLRRLLITQTPVRDHQLMQVWKTCKKHYNDNNKKSGKHQNTWREGKLQAFENSGSGHDETDTKEK